MAHVTHNSSVLSFCSASAAKGSQIPFHTCLTSRAWAENQAVYKQTLVRSFGDEVIARPQQNYDTLKNMEKNVMKLRKFIIVTVRGMN